MPVISVTGLEYRIGTQEVLSDISFEIEQGDYVAVIGPNGGGKTTLIKALLGLVTPTKGSIKIFGKEIGQFKEWHRIGYVPQNVSQFDSNFPLSVYETVSLGLAAKKSWFSFLNDEDRRKIESVLEMASITDLREKNLSELSGGQRQRVMIARALVSKPDILILDEPSTGVDIASQKKFYRFLRKLNTENHLTIVFITHDLGVIADDVTHVLSVNQKLLFSGTSESMLSCEGISEIYGTKTHVLHHHCGGHQC